MTAKTAAATGHSHVLPRAPVFAAAVSAPAAGLALTNSSETFRSRADCQRSSGSLARQRCRMPSSDGCAISEIDGAGRSIMAAITLAGDEPSKARLPVSISYSTRPNEKMSLRASTSWPVAWACNCSGDM